MVEYRRDPVGLKQAVREHSIHGYPMSVPIFDLARGLSTSSIRGLTSVLVEPYQPMPFEEVVKRRRWTSEKHDLGWWKDYGERRHPQSPLGFMHPHSIAMLEDGYPQSMREIQAAWLRALGHMDSNDMVSKFSFNLNEVVMDSEQVSPGMIVEYIDRETNSSFPGRIYAMGEDPKDGTPAIYFEPFTPVPTLLGPASISPWLTNESMVSNMTWALGKGTLEAMRLKRRKIPKGHFDPKDDKRRVYFLDEPMPVAKVEEFCKKYYPEHPDCVWQSMVYLLLPLHPAPDKLFGQGELPAHKGGYFRPYPDDTVRTDIEADIDYFTEGMRFED